VEVSYSSNLGIRIGNRMRVLRSYAHHNGTVNIGGVGKSVLVDGLVSTYGNNGCPNNPGFESGGSKFVRTDSLIVRNSTFSNNCGVGLWLDILNVNYQLYNNTVANNVREGICIEVSYGGKVFNNTVSGNGWPTDPYRANGWLWDAGIGIHASPNVEVYGNTLNENFQGIVIIQQPRNTSTGDAYAPAGGFIAQNIYVHDNIIYQRVAGGDGSAGGGAVTDAGDTAIFTSRNNRWVRNTYYLGTNARPFAWMGGWRTAAEWRAYGQDGTGSFNP
jgi:parallel beta-helix repeat protein